MKPLITLLLIIIHSQFCFCQSFKNEFYPNANGTIYNRKVNALSFITKEPIDTFLHSLTKRFGSPIHDGNLYIFKGYNKYWTREQVIIRIEPSTLIGLDSGRYNDVFIFVETKKRLDLLNKKRSSYKKIEKYFLELYIQTVKTLKADY